MPQFEVDNDLVEIVWQLARPKPFEQLTFNAALRRILLDANAVVATPASVGEPPVPGTSHRPLATTGLWQKKAPSPDPTEWAASIPELRGHRDLNTWQAICNVLRIKVAGDSARRKLRNWVKMNKPNWPEVPGIDSDA